MVNVVLHAPVGQRRHAAAAGYQLQHRHRQFRRAPFQVDARGLQHLADQVDALLGHRIGNQRFAGQVRRLQAPLVAQPVFVGDDRQDLEAEQRRHLQPALGWRLGADHHVRLAVRQQRERIGVETRHEVDFHLRPAAAELVHHRHQPVETRVALQHHA
ncbi:hypothetical protein D3C86_1692880 [compost metagenome]